MHACRFTSRLGKTHPFLLELVLELATAWLAALCQRPATEEWRASLSASSSPVDFAFSFVSSPSLRCDADAAAAAVAGASA